MGDTTTGPATQDTTDEQDTVVTEPADDGDTVESLRAQAAKWKALSRKHENHAKTNADAAKRLAEIEDAQKTEAEKTAERLAAAEERASAAERTALRLQVAADKGLTPKQAARLVGATREELEADADELLSDFAPTADKDTQPAADFGGGARGGDVTGTKADQITSRDALKSMSPAEIVKAKAEGRLDDLLGTTTA